MYKVTQYINFSSCIRSELAWAENPGLGQHTFGPQFPISQHFEQHNCSLPHFCTTHSFWRSLSNGCMFLYTRTMLSDKQSEHSFSPTTSV